jgi:hypothetical protein
MEPVTPLDLPGGRALQEEKVMGAIYGRSVFPGAADDGIKACGPGVLHRRLLADVVGEMNRQISLSGVVAGCTEVGLAFAAETAIAGVPLYDPLVIGAEAAVRRAKSGTSTAKQAE